jgi:type VI protein secretion system component VasF
MADEKQSRSSLKLTEACWPVFDFLINFDRLCNHQAAPPADQAHYEAKSALRDAEDAAREDTESESAWHGASEGAPSVKAMMVYLIDYKMKNSDWPGATDWTDLETDPDGLNDLASEGGEKFFEHCNEMQRNYEESERRDRRDKDKLAEVLSLYFTCLRLGFKGQYRDTPQELADYTRRLYARLPAYNAVRGGRMFPEAYKHNQEVRVDYKLGVSLTIVLTTFTLIVAAWVVMSRAAWNATVEDLQKSAKAWSMPPNAFADEEPADGAADQG